MTKDEALKMAIDALAKCKEAYLAGPNWQKVGYDILDKSQQACKEALERPAQEIVRKVFDIDNFHSSVLNRIKFTSPQQWQGNKEFVGLSNDRIREIGDNCLEKNNGLFNWIDFARAIEQASRNKNGY